MSDFEKRHEAEQLETAADQATQLARKLGLEPYPVNYWIVDYDEMNQLIAYDGFQRRYPHWRWGMKYDRQQKQGQFLGGKAFEIVNNDNPAHAFLQVSNDRADQKAVITHVEAHADFFNNNEWFGLFDRDPDAAALLERHAETIGGYIDDPEIDRGDIERWIDHVLCLEDNVEQHRPYEPVEPTEDAEAIESETVEQQLEELDVSEDVRQQVFDDLEGPTEDSPAGVPAEPEADLLAFLREHGMQYDADAGKAVEMAEWQREVIEILRRESYYFAPQKMTKIMNEGWACVTPDTRVFTAEGLIEMEDVVENHTPVSDGESRRPVYDSHVIEDHETVSITTRRGFELTGSNNHRVRRPDGSWVRLDELSAGDTIEISGGNGLWPEEYVSVNWDNPEYVTLEDVASKAGVSVSTVSRYRRLGRAERSDAIDEALAAYGGRSRGFTQTDPIRVPETVTERVARFLGLFIGDGHVPSDSGHIGFTSESQARAEEFAGLVVELFDVEPTVSEQGSRWRVYAYSKNLRAFLAETFELPQAKAAARKTVPEQIRRSPKPVVAEFLRGLFDADGYADDQGAILSTKSESMSRTVQLLLTNFGILSRRREQTDGCYHVHLTGRSAERFAEEIGFGYTDKATALKTYLEDLAWFEQESWTDEIVEITEGTDDVYDISVRETHRYAAAGLINHNSKWESLMMAGENFADDDEFLTYADHMAQVLGSEGLNPYSLGLQLWQYIENRTNRRHVVELLLRVEGITWRNFHDEVDFDRVLELLEPDELVASVDPDPDALAAVPANDPRIDAEALVAARTGELDLEQYPWKLFTYEGLAERHYSLVRPENRGYLGRIALEDLERIARYMFDDARYDSVRAAIEDIEYTAGWDRMYEVRESHNDVTFIDEFLTQEFVDEHDYFTYEYTHASEDYRVTSTDYEDVKRKLMLEFTNFGKPTIVVADGNYRNRNELLLEHEYNGVALDLEQARDTLERVFELWGRPVALRTIVKEYDEHDIEVARRRDGEPEPTERGRELRYDGVEFAERELDWETVEHLAATNVDYDTKPEEWLA